MYTLKKSLGQHFLKDENICRKIVSALEAKPFARLLEVGPGGGALTKYLLQLPGIDFKAVEVDDEKVVYLKQTYPGIEDKLIHKSFLDIGAPFTEPFTVVGNFPYNISTEIVFKIIAWRALVEGCVGMFQKEVAQRFAAAHGNKVYGVTSVLTQAFFDVEYLFDVPQGAFNPPPKVMSGVIRLTPRREPLAIASEKKLFTLVKAAFNQRRKQLRNAVKGLFSAEELQDEGFNRRAEQLSVSEFAELTHRML
ncbi:ribosomal RNA small subunit methyltransferase A [Flaviaesturariibacter flavus]|uniref:Ribosomal RNA small subunit methyltransferase A n=1 Tax=Flaviaesturariibacter flavus TaxID=2502780 RepID=A0A4R1BNC5_9BACT|nr:16S rRNA (adenine(1518)-N(6)/adenine(1519)-N(6))-dimethyltransferase RsmA [Flaviaesturariibacter flavus]TCJ18825.1 ribosomal RNA small subunit methyltransferase A [Flaviaesturariibacter flavus]